jgi:hypothetical protein
MTPVGFSHSEISGSKPVCDSPELIAANYVLHRLLTPRHPSCALSSLTTNLWLGGLCHQNYRDTPLAIARETLEGSTSPAVTAVGRCPSTLTRGIEVEARRASSNLSDFLRRSFCSRHALASSSSIHLSKNLGGLFDLRPKPPTLELKAFVRARSLDSVFRGGA